MCCCECVLMKLICLILIKPIARFFSSFFYLTVFLNGVFPQNTTQSKHHTPQKVNKLHTWENERAHFLKAEKWWSFVYVFIFYVSIFISFFRAQTANYHLQFKCRPKRTMDHQARAFCFVAKKLQRINTSNISGKKHKVEEETHRIKLFFFSCNEKRRFRRKSQHNKSQSIKLKKEKNAHFYNQHHRTTMNSCVYFNRFQHMCAILDAHRWIFNKRVFVLKCVPVHHAFYRAHLLNARRIVLTHTNGAIPNCT